jgi:hypothetical protein
VGLVTLAARIDHRWLLVVLVAAVDAWAVQLLLRSKASLRDRILWTIVVLACPVIGCLFWFVLGPKPRIAGGAGEPDGSWPRRRDVMNDPRR